MKFRIGLVAFIILVALIGVAAFLFLPRGGAKNGIFFNTYEGVYAKITGSVSGNANSITLSDLTYSEGAKPTASELASWQVNLEFGEEDEITITINVENKNTNKLYVIFKDDKQTINNVTKTILNDGRSYTSGKVVLLLSDTDTTLFTITFRRDQDVITSIRYNYHIELKAEVTDADIQDGSIEAEENSGYTYEFNNKKNTATITGLSASNTQANLDLPNVVAHENQLYLITAIGNDAFKNKTTITSVTIPNTVTELKSGVFEGCTNLTDVTIPTSVTKLGSKVFKDCSNLITIELPNTISSIGTHLFSGCTKLTTYNIPSQITKLGSRMFENCERITEFTFPTQITTLGDYVFNGLGFETLTIPDTITTLTENSFSGITNIGELTIPCSVTSLDGANDGLFANVNRLQNANIIVTGENTGVGNAFKNCSKIKNITINDDVTVINSGAFSGCGTLESLTVPFVGGSSAFAASNSVKLLGYVFGTTSYTGAEKITQIYGSLQSYVRDFYIPTSLKTVNITKYNLSYGSFSYCKYVENVTLPLDITFIPNLTFTWCTGLISVDAPDTLVEIGQQAFYHCEKLESIDFVRNADSIGAYAFNGCTSLKYAFLSSEVELNYHTGAAIFNKCSENLIIYTDKVNATGWKVGWNTVDSNEEKLAMVRWNMTYEQTLEDISAGEQLQNIYSDYVFMGRNIIEYVGTANNIVIPEGTIVLKDELFKNNDSIQNVSIPSSVKYISAYAFYGCVSLVGVMIGSGVIGIYTYAFYNCNNLTNITIPDSVTSIGTYAFGGCGGLVTVTIDSSSVYTAATSTLVAGRLLGNATTIYVLASVVEDINNTNAFLNDTNNYTKSANAIDWNGGQYYQYQKVVNNG